jgi:hypothetical protein
VSDLEDPKGFASAATVARYHAEANRRWENHAAEHKEIAEAIGLVRETLVRIDERLNEAKPHRWTWPERIGAITALLAIIAMPAVSLIRSPSRDDYVEAQKQITSLQIQQVRLESTITLLQREVEHVHEMVRLVAKGNP